MVALFLYAVELENNQRVETHHNTKMLVLEMNKIWHKK